MCVKVNWSERQYILKIDAQNLNEKNVKKIDQTDGNTDTN